MTKDRGSIYKISLKHISWKNEKFTLYDHPPLKKKKKKDGINILFHHIMFEGYKAKNI